MTQRYAYRLRVQGATDRATAWFARPDLVVTAAHAVADKSGAQYSWKHLQNPERSYVLDLPSGPVTLLPLELDSEGDLALLRPAQEVFGVDVLTLAALPPIEGSPFKLQGFPLGRGDEVEGLTGTIQGELPGPVDRALRLNITPAPGHEAWKGGSGAPVLVNEQVVGVLLEVPPNYCPRGCTAARVDMLLKQAPAPPPPHDRLLRILHLADLRLESGRRPDARVLDLLGLGAQLLAAGRGPDLVVITGDLVHSPLPLHYSYAGSWLREALLPAFNLGPQDLALVGGARDQDSVRLEDMALDSLEALNRSGDPDHKLDRLLSNPQQAALLLAGQQAFVQFRDTLQGWGLAAGLPWWQERRRVRGVDLHLIGLSSSWAQSARGPSPLGARSLPRPQDFTPDDLRVLLLGQPWSDLAAWDLKRCRPLLDPNIDLTLHGGLGGLPLDRRLVHSRDTLELGAVSVAAGEISLLELHPQEGTLKLSRFFWRQGWTAADAQTIPLRVLKQQAQPPASRSDYAERLRARSPALPKVFQRHGGPRALREVFVAVELSAEHGPERLDPERDPSDLPRAPIRIEKVPELSHKRWILLGDPGSGKTTLLFHLAEQLLESDALTPVLLKVADLVPFGQSNRSWEQAAARLCTEAQLAWLRARAAQGRVALLLDGLDEVLEPDRARAALQELSATLGACPLLVSSRRDGYNRPEGDFRELALCPLGQKEQRTLLLTWVGDPARVDQALADLHRRPRLRKLAENPLLLTLVGLVLRDGHTLPRGRGKLYELAIRRLLRRDFSPGASTESAPRLEPELVLQALGKLALALHGKHTEVYPTRDMVALLRQDADLRQQVQECCGTAERFLQEVAWRTGLLVEVQSDDDDTQGYTFPHRTFREYLAALALRQDLRRHGVGPVSKDLLQGALHGDRPPQPVVSGGVLDVLLPEAAARPSLWSEALALCCGISPDEAEGLVLRVAAQGRAELLRRVLADAEGLSADLVWRVLGLNPAPGAWEDRRALIEGLPELVGDLGLAMGLACRLAEHSSNGNDLWFVRMLLIDIGLGRITGEAQDWTPEDLRAEALDRARRLLSQHRPEHREAAKAAVRALMVPIPAGHFLMGSPETEVGRYSDEGPQHPVTLTQPFQMLKVPVTNALYELFDPDHDHAFKTPDIQDHPVVKVTWWEAAMFAEWVGCTLPSEAEWEYAARAGTQVRFYKTYDKDEDLKKMAWYGQNSKDRTHAVAGLEANDWKLHDMLGNCWEWCLDHWRGNYGDAAPVTDPLHVTTRGDKDATLVYSCVHVVNKDGDIVNSSPPRVVRGGSWIYDSGLLRCASRSRRDPQRRNLDLGFRVVLRLSPEHAP